MLAAVGADPPDADPVATLEDAEAVDALRVEYRRVLLRLVARDLAHGVGVDDVAAEICDLAAGDPGGRAGRGPGPRRRAAATCRLAVIAMGKCGGHELNYVSDVDVVFVAEPVDGAEEQPAMRAATQLASQLMRICGDQTAEGTIWPVDAALRPEGRSGPLVRTLASTRATTSAGPRRGSSRRCSRPGRSPATPRWVRRTSRRWGRWSGRPRSATAS